MFFLYERLNISNILAKIVLLHERMQISKAEANLLSLNFLQKKTGRRFPLIEIKYGNKAYIIPILTYHMYTHQLLSQSRKKR